MRRIGITAMIAVLALAAAALVGASSAGAVTICMEEGNGSKTCPEGKRYLGREYKAKLKAGTKAKLIGAIIAPECTTSTITAKTAETSGNPLSGQVLGFTLGGCDTCNSQTILGLPYKVAITSSGDGKKDGDLKVTTSESGGPPGIELAECASQKCIFGAAEEKIDLEFKGGGTGAALIVASLEPFQYIGGTSETICGKTAKFTATYELIEPTSAWITAAP